MKALTTTEPSGPSPGAPGLEKRAAEIRENFRRIRRFIQLGLIISYLAPMALLSAYFHLQFNLTLKESGKQHLITLAESERNTIDLFLQERVVNILNLFRGKDFKLPPSPEDMQRYLQSLREMSDAFSDVGFFDASGVQLGYAGPYPSLQGRNYSRETWFQAVMAQDRDYYISDVYLGFRQKLHFTIAVKEVVDGRPVIMRATLDPDKFYLFLRSIGRGKGVDLAVVNREGKYQVVDLEQGELLGQSNYLPPTDRGSGANEITTPEGASLVAYAWLNEVPWALVVRQPLRVAYAQMYRARNLMIVSTGVLVLLLVTAIWFATDRLLKKAQATAEARAELQSQLIQVSKLASAGELAAGVAHEINNPLAVIAAESGLLQDLLNPEFGQECPPERIRQGLAEIDTAVFRARDITQKLLNFVRRREPSLVNRDLNQILEEVVGGLMEHQMQVSNIKLVRDYDPGLPAVRCDPDQIRQVFLNIVNNAHDATAEGGTITLATRHDKNSVRVTVSDTGKGMTAEQLEKIFLPFYTTKEVGKGTGLGLPISLSIVESLGGQILAQSLPGAGSSFTVTLPLEPGPDHAQT